MSGINTHQPDEDYGVSSEDLLRESQVVRHEKQIVHGAEAFDHGTAWAVLVGAQSYMIEKNSPNFTLVMAKLGLAQEANKRQLYEDAERLKKEAARLLVN